MSTLRAKVRRLFNKAKQYGNWLEYSEVLTTYNKEIRRAKRENFRTFCENIESTPVAARLHKALAKDRVEMKTTLKKPDGTFTEDE